MLHDDPPLSKRKGQALHDRVEADAASQSEIGSLSDLQLIVNLEEVSAMAWIAG
jgi:hypothetical protein